MITTASSFFMRILSDRRVNVHHIGTYLTLIFIWHRNRELCPFQITRQRVMKMSRINSTSTYHKYIRELQKLGYIKYQPSFNPKEGSKVWLT